MGWDDFRKTREELLEAAVADGKVDELMVKLLRSIFLNRDLATLSSCSGRVVLLEFDFAGRKKASKYIAKWHRKVEPEEVELAIASYGGKAPLWFKVEPFILHVAAKDVRAANSFLMKMRAAGVKRGGIQSVKKDKVSVEVQGNNLMVIPVGDVEGEWDRIVATSNLMLEDNFAVVRKLEKTKW